MKYFKLIFSLVAFLLVANTGHTAHILGGDMSVTHVSDSTFHVKLQLFRDCNTSGADLDDELIVYVYEEGTNTLLTDYEFQMFLGNEEFPELGDECFTPDLCLQIGTYELDVVLPDNPNGLYLVWERCCRVDATTNLDDPFDIGMVFTATVPDPHLQNSSPVFDAYPAAGYFCVGLEASFSFGATDADGDSLVYILTQPIQGDFTIGGQIEPDGGGPKPFTPVPWETGYSLADVLGSGIPLTVDPNTGLVVGTADAQGQYCFGVICEEWRDGVKLGEVRREINVFATTDCQAAIDVAINGGVQNQQVDLFAFFQHTIDINTVSTIEDSLSVAGLGDIFVEGNYDVVAILGIDTIGFSLSGELNGQIFWDTLTCAMIRDEPYLVQIEATAIGHCPPFETQYDTLTMEIFINMPPDNGTEWNVDLSPLYQPDPLYPWTGDSLINGGQSTVDYFVFPAQEDERCVTISWEDNLAQNGTINHWDTISVELNRADVDVFGRDNAPIFNDSTLYYANVSGNTMEISGDFCWTPECDQIRDDPYRFTFNSKTVACDVVIDQTHYLDIYVFTRSDGLLDTVPNVFTPNNDGMNDIWDIGHKDDFCIVNDNIKIFNRWGEPVYESDELLETWDGMHNGNPVSPGEYFYVVTYDFVTGFTDTKEYTGTITKLE